MVMALVFLFVFLFLAAQYESWTVPIAVLLSLPVAALGAYLGVWVCGLENDVYFQIGLVMLVGLAAKNAILIVEFAKVQVDKGEDLIQSAIYAACSSSSRFPASIKSSSRISASNLLQYPTPFTRTPLLRSSSISFFLRL